MRSRCSLYRALKIFKHLKQIFKNFYIDLFNYRQLMIFIITSTRPWKLCQLLRHTEIKRQLHLYPILIRENTYLHLLPGTFCQSVVFSFVQPSCMVRKAGSWSMGFGTSFAYRLALYFWLYIQLQTWQTEVGVSSNSISRLKKILCKK